MIVLISGNGYSDWFCVSIHINSNHRHNLGPHLFLENDPGGVDYGTCGDGHRLFGIAFHGTRSRKGEEGNGAVFEDCNGSHIQYKNRGESMSRRRIPEALHARNRSRFKVNEEETTSERIGVCSRTMFAIFRIYAFIVLRWHIDSGKTNGVPKCN